MMTEKAIVSDLPVPPGEYLEEVLLELGMSKEELARRMDRPSAKLSAIFKGEKAITPETALQLEKVVGVPAHIWTGLESEYRLTLARTDEKAQVEKQLPLISKFCYKQLVKLKVFEGRKEKKTQLEELHRFFGVTSLFNVKNISRYQPAFRCAKTKTSQSPEATAAWLRMGEIRARAVDCGPFDKIKLKAMLPTLRNLTLKGSSALNEDMPKTLAEAGVAFVLLPHLNGTYAHGAAFSVGKERAVLMTTIRYKWADIVWFSIFHEIAHLLLHTRDEVILECKNDVSRDIDKEKESDAFAAETLIPEKHYQEFLSKTSFTETSIRQFAADENIDPGIVVGRLQHNKKIIPPYMNNLRTRFEWEN